MVRKNKQEKGTTLIEMMVYIALLGVVFTGIYGVLIATLRYYRIADTSATLQQNALNAITKITYELTETTANDIYKNTRTIVVYSSGNPRNVTITEIMFPSPRNIETGIYTFDNYGRMKWQKWVCYYFKQSGNTYNLVKKEKEIPTLQQTNHPGTPPYPNVATFANANLPEKVIARGAEGLTINNQESFRKFNVNITIDRTTDTTRPNKITAETEVLVRN